MLKGCLHNGKHNRKKMATFLSLNGRFTKATKALSACCNSCKDQDQLLLDSSVRLKKYRATRKILWQVMRSTDLRREALVVSRPGMMNEDFLLKIMEEIRIVRDECWEEYYLEPAADDDMGGVSAFVTEAASAGRGVRDPQESPQILDSLPPSMEQSLPSPSLSTSISGESLNVFNNSMTALTSTRHSNSMIEFNSLVDQFRENQDEVSFILSSIDLTEGLGPLQVADHCESLGDAKKLLRSMSVTLGSISRHHRNVITSDYIISITATLHDISSMRNVCLGELDKKSEGHEAASVYPRVLTAGAIADDDSNGLAIEPKEIAAPVKCEPSGFDIKMESLAVEEALDDAKEVDDLTAGNA